MRRTGSPRRHRRQRASSRPRSAKYAEVPKVYAQVDAAEADLELAMGQEIRYSFVLNDLSLTIPSDVWLEHDQPSPRTWTAPQPITSPLGNPAVGDRDGHRARPTSTTTSRLARLAHGVRLLRGPLLQRLAVGDPINDKDDRRLLLVRRRSPTRPTPTATARSRGADHDPQRIWTLGTAAVVALVLLAGWFLLVAAHAGRRGGHPGADGRPGGGQRPAGRQDRAAEGAGAGPACAGGRSWRSSARRSPRSRPSRPSSGS